MLGKKYYSDNDFTIEFWFYPEILSTSEIPLVGDPIANVGVFYENGNIVFKLNAESLEYTLPSKDTTYHVVCIYSVTSASIYVNGDLVKFKLLSGFEFNNATLSLISGPTPNSSDFFLINSVAIYRYGLSASQILYHYSQNQEIPPVQVADPDNGELFQIFDDNISTVFTYAYPGNKSWQDFTNSDLFYDETDDSISIAQSTGSKSVVISDYILVPDADLDSSKIQWDGDNGITVEASVDDVAYIPCVNGGSIPQYRLNNFDSSKKLYIKITMSSSNSARYLPKLKTFMISFYKNQKHYSLNSQNYISMLYDIQTITDPTATLGADIYPVLSRDYRNGISCVSGSGFYLNTSSSILTSEFFFKPETLSSASGLLYSSSSGPFTASSISWDNSGVVSKTNISAIYVNGINKTSETLVSNIFKPNDLNHVVVVFSSAITGPITFNYSSSGSIAAKYQNIITYGNAFDSQKALDHFNLWVYREARSVSDSTSSSMLVTESAVNYYNNDWIVVQSI